MTPPTSNTGPNWYGYRLLAAYGERMIMLESNMWQEEIPPATQVTTKVRRKNVF